MAKIINLIELKRLMDESAERQKEAYLAGEKQKLRELMREYRASL